MSTALAEYVCAEEIADGATQKQAAIVATSVLVSPEYRAAWLAGCTERLREREEREEALLAELCYPGNPRLEEL